MIVLWFCFFFSFFFVCFFFKCEASVMVFCSFSCSYASPRASPRVSAQVSLKKVLQTVNWDIGGVGHGRTQRWRWNFIVTQTWVINVYGQEQRSEKERQEFFFFPPPFWNKAKKWIQMRRRRHMRKLWKLSWMDKYTVTFLLMDYSSINSFYPSFQIMHFSNQKTFGHKTRHD